MKVKVIFLKANPDDALTLDVDKALKALGDNSDITHVVFCVQGFVYDLTTKGLFFFEEEHFFKEASKSVVEVITYNEHEDLYFLLVSYLYNALENSTRLHEKDLRSWYKNKGNLKTFLCTDFIIEALGLPIDISTKSLSPSEFKQALQNYLNGE